MYDHFRRCWLTLRATASAKLRKQMDGIELGVEGISVARAKPTNTKEDFDDERKLTRI